MASSRLFSVIGPSILRNSHNYPQPKFFFTPPCASRVLLRYSSSSSTAVTLDTDDASASAVSSGHPWPEWVTFCDRLKAKGYLPQNEVAVYADINLLKDACLSFGKDRFDIFKSLSTQDIQTVVEQGCPNLFRKAVNSAKRLRAYLQLEEADVCGSCTLRGSCDRAYLLLNESEAAARTVDIVRILLLHALDPLVISPHPGRELVEASAKKLLSQLIELADTAPDPQLPKPAAVTQKKKQTLDLFDNESSRDAEMKRGDWVCSTCKFMNYARNTQCLKCQAAGPERTFGIGAQRKKGDWDCPECSFMNFASKKQCFRCQEPRPQRDLKPGDWECPKCDFPNYSRNNSCKKCNLERPQGSMMESGEHTWRRPY